MRRSLLLLAVTIGLIVTFAHPGRTAACPADTPPTYITFTNLREYVTKQPVGYADEVPLRSIITADIWIQPTASIAASELAFTIDYHLLRTDIREWMTQHIWPAPVAAGQRQRLGIWQQRTFPGVNILEIHTRFGTTRFCWNGV